MLDQDVIDAFNARPRVDLNNIKTMTASQQDRVKVWGSQAENLLSNREFAMFVHQFRFEMIDVLSEIRTHTETDNITRVAITNQLAGVDSFIALLKRAKYMKDRVVTLQEQKLSSKEPGL